MLLHSMPYEHEYVWLFNVKGSYGSLFRLVFWRYGYLAAELNYFGGYYGSRDNKPNRNDRYA